MKDCTHAPIDGRSMDDGEIEGDDPPVKESEIGVAVLRIDSKNTGIEPDGIPVLARILDYKSDRLGELSDANLTH